MKKVFTNLRPVHFAFMGGFFISLVAVISCSKEVGSNSNYGLNPAIKTNPSLPSQPYSYNTGGDNNLTTLGRVLFYDKNMSGDGSVSCSSCHQQDHAFSDSKPFSFGFNGEKTARNAHPIINTGNSLFWDGKIDNTVSSGGYEGAASTAISVPLNTHAELNMPDPNELVQRLSSLPYYPYLADKVKKGRPLDFVMIENALGAFMANITADKSKYKQVFPSSGTPTASFTQSETNGMNIFNGKGKCYLCHLSQNNFSGNPDQFEDIGLDSAVYPDKGRELITHMSLDRAKFHVPSLMNVALTAPYMHDGRFAKLEDVIDFFSDGVKNSMNISSAFSMHPSSNGNGGYNTGGLVVHPKLTATEKADLLAFLQTLTDASITTDVRLSDPFKH